MQQRVIRNVPYSPDIEAIRRAYPDERLSVGLLIGYDDIAKVIGERYGSSRYCAVTKAWRKTVETESGLFIGCNTAERSFEVLSEPGKLKASQRFLKTGSSFVKRAANIAARIDAAKLSESEKLNLDFMTRRTAAMLLGERQKGNFTLPESF